MGRRDGVRKSGNTLNLQADSLLFLLDPNFKAYSCLNRVDSADQRKNKIHGSKELPGEFRVGAGDNLDQPREKICFIYCF